MLRSVRSGKLLRATIIAAGDIVADAHSGMRSFAFILAFVATLFIFVPFYPGFPGFGGHSSWIYAMNEAISRNMVFGRDVVFTFGPLASVYSRIYHPATDPSMLGFGTFFAAAFFAGGLALCRGSYLILALPLIISQVVLPDPFYICLPFTFLLVATQWATGETETRVSAWGLIAFIGAAVALSLLVKASFSVPVVACGGLALILIGRRSIAAAALLAIWTIVAVAIAWCFMGQPLSGLPGYFLAQRPIISGYSEAMSLTGPVTQVIAYLTGALVIWLAFVVGASSRFGKPTTVLTALGLAIVLFVAFKEGFVRHDDHALVAGGTLLASSFILLLTFRSRLFAVVMIVGIGGWTAVDGAYINIDPVSAVSRFRASVFGSWEGVRLRISDPTYFPKRFEIARAEIRSKLPLPATNATVDLYPINLSAVFAAGQNWSPRPVIQSYSAYTSSLAALNRDHLKGASAPDRVYFSIAPIDGRYPSLDDGASWPELIARYRVTSYFDQYAVMEKRSQPIAVIIGAPLLDQKDAPLGEQVPIPTTNAPVWARINVAPTLMGRVVSALYKLPPLQLVVKYADGATENFRFIPGEAHSGFLLSPPVRNAVDLMALQSTRREDFFKGRTPVSIGIMGDSSSHFPPKAKYLWKPQYSIVLSELEFPPDQRVASLLFRKAIPIPQSAVKGGNCYIDTINETAAQTSPAYLKQSFFSVSGWGVVSGSEGKPNDEVFIALRSSDGTAEMVEADKIGRDDVNASFKQPHMGKVGFEALLDASAMHGRYTLSVVQKVGDTYLECEPGRTAVETPG
jgi:hypothetical protein